MNWDTSVSRHGLHFEINSHIYQQMHNIEIKSNIKGTNNSYIFQCQGIIFRELQTQSGARTDTSILELQRRV